MDMRSAVHKEKSARHSTRRLADDIRASLHEALDMAAGKRTGAMVHKVKPRATDARDARLKLGLSQREFAAFIGTGIGTVANGSSARASRPARRAR